MSHTATYTAAFPWSRRVWIVTSLYFIFAVALVAFLIYVWVNHSAVAGIVGLVIALPLLLSIVVYCEGFSPQRLEISGDQITVLRRYDSVTILRSTIIDITPLGRADMSWTISMGGCGGLFGYFGTFTNRKLGQFTMYATTMENLFLIRTADGRSTVISCSEPELLQKIG